MRLRGWVMQQGGAGEGGCLSVQSALAYRRLPTWRQGGAFAKRGVEGGSIARVVGLWLSWIVLDRLDRLA